MHLLRRAIRTPEPKHHHEPQSSSSGWTSSTSGSTVVDNSSGFAGSEAPGSPAEVAARHNAAGFLCSSTSGGSESSNGGQQQKQQKQRRQWGRPSTKLGLHVGRSSSSDTPSDTERKRKADGSAHRPGGGGGGGGGGGATAAATGFGGSMNFSRQPGGRGRVVDNRFEVLDTLGTGYSGKVKRAINHQTGEVVALKVMDKLGHGDPNSARRFNRLQREVDAMRKCASHPHTVALKEARFNAVYPKKSGESVDAHILVLELCEKGELFDLLYGGGPVPAEVCQEYFRQLMSGIKFCHDQGVCHRDLKPENLLLDSDFTLKIADFGFAASGRAGMMCNSIVGSKTYMAPEVLNRGSQMYHQQDQGYDGAKADVWSAGVILFTMLAGHPPMEKAMSSDWWFRALKLNRHDLFWQSHETTAAARARETNTAPVRFTDQAKHLVSAMLTVEPAHRISVDQIMALDYLALPAPGWMSFGSPADPRARLREVMQARYNASMASKRLCTVASSSRGTADSAGAEGSGSPSAASASASAASSATAATAGVPRPYEKRTHRSPGDDCFDVPSMTEEEAARVSGGFMAVGSVWNLVKALEKALSGMGAKIDGLDKDGTRALRQTFKVSAKMPEDNKHGGGPVGMVAKVFRVTNAPSSVSKMDQGDDGAGAGDKLVVVLRRKRGDYYRYRKVEDALVSLLTGGGARRQNASAMDQSVNMSPVP